MRFLYIAAVFWCASAGAQQQSAYRACMEPEVVDAKFDSVRAKTPLIGGAAAVTFIMLADKTKVDDAQKEAVAAWADVAMRCFTQDAPYRQSMAPGFAPIMESSQGNFIRLAARLYSGDLTFGEFNEGRQLLAQDTKQRFDQLRQRYESRQQAAQESDDQARRQMALQYLMGQQAAQRAPMVAPLQLPPQPAVTNCYRFGAQTTCTTR